MLFEGLNKEKDVGGGMEDSCGCNESIRNVQFSA
jgi:hypothetical protein